MFNIMICNWWSYQWSNTIESVHSNNHVERITIVVCRFMYMLCEIKIIKYV